MTAPAGSERKLRELSFLQEVAQLAGSTHDWDEMLRIVIDRTTFAMGVEVASLYLVERRESVVRLVATNGLDRRGIGRVTLRLGEGITGWVANAHVPAVVRDVRADPRWKRIPMVDEGRFRSMLSMPLTLRDEIVGVINVQTVQLREFTGEDVEFLRTIADQVAGIIERARLHRDSERKLREVTALFEVSNVLTSTLELDEVLRLVVDRLTRVYPGSAGAIVMHDAGRERIRARSGELGRAVLDAAETALRETRPVVGFDHLALPLLAGDRLLGAVALQVPDYKEFLDEEVAFVGALANQAALAIDKASLYARERQTAEDLREVERARAELVAVVTHDLRTPLSVIRGYLDVLGANGSRKAAAEAVRQIARMDQLVDRILAGVRISAPDVATRRSRFDLRALVADLEPELAAIAHRHRVRSVRRARPLLVRGDKRRTAEVLSGLVHNASKYSPEGTEIEIGLATRRGRAVVRVSDRGHGIAPEDRNRAFEPYVRVGETAAVPGTGIGLYAARRTVEAQGGDLWYEEREGGGSVFAFTVPLAKQ